MSKNSLYLMNFNNHAILSHQYYPCLLTILTKYKNVVTLNHEWNNIQRIVQLQTSLNFVEFGIYHTLAPLLNPNWVHSRVLIELCQATIKVVT